jgi:hypothetical protein
MGFLVIDENTSPARGKQGDKSMKRTTIMFSVLMFSLTVLYAAPASGDLVGTWTTTVEYNQSFDDYTINLTANGRCTVKVSGDSADQETTGNWSYDGTMFKLNATFRNAKLTYLKSIQWTSMLSLAADNNSFNILGKTAANGTQVRITFFRQDGSVNQEAFNQSVIPQIFAALSADIPARLRLAVVGIDSPNPDEAAFYVNELTLQFFNSKNYTIVERSNIDAVFKEQGFQLSGYVDDDAMVSIGKFIGANVVITGSISGTGSHKRMVIKAIDVLTSEIRSMTSVSL